LFNGNQAASFQDNDNAKQFAERVTFEPASGLTLALNATQRNDSLTGALMNAYGGDLSWRPGRATIEAEVLAGDGDAQQKLLGGYLVGAWRFGKLEPVVRLECLFADISRPANRTTAVTAGLNWYLHKRFGIKTNLVADTRPGQELGYEARVQLQAGF
jgi:hypothetical protein